MTGVSGANKYNLIDQDKVIFKQLMCIITNITRSICINDLCIYDYYKIDEGDIPHNIVLGALSVVQHSS